RHLPARRGGSGPVNRPQRAAAARAAHLFPEVRSTERGIFPRSLSFHLRPKRVVETCPRLASSGCGGTRAQSPQWRRPNEIDPFGAKAAAHCFARGRLVDADRDG